MKILSSFAALTVALAPLHAAPEIGKPAPDFTLKDLDGKEHTLSALKGKTVVLEWINFGCPFVKKHYESKAMQNLQKAAAAEGVVWLTICSSAPGKQGNETPETGKTVSTQLGSAAAAYLKDEDGAVGRLYQARATPEMYIINKEGTLMYMGAIDNKPTPNPASLDGALNYVREALTEIKDGRPVTTPVTKAYGCSVKY